MGYKDSIDKVSAAVIRRLPRYRRCLEELSSKGVARISSKELSKILGYTASQIRQDLNNFGGFGQQGYGYNVDELYKVICEILGLNREYHVIVIGAGNLGQAIVNYTNYNRRGFKIRAIFDVNPKLIGININGVEVLDYEYLSGYLEQNDTDIGVICTSKGSAQEVANKLVDGNVKGIWNFVAADIKTNNKTVVENVYLSDSLHSLAYYINHTDIEE